MYRIIYNMFSFEVLHQNEQFSSKITVKIKSQNRFQLTSELFSCMYAYLHFPVKGYSMTMNKNLPEVEQNNLT